MASETSAELLRLTVSEHKNGGELLDEFNAENSATASCVRCSSEVR
jgi:hypothetical protein